MGSGRRVYRVFPTLVYYWVGGVGGFWVSRAGKGFGECFYTASPKKAGVGVPSSGAKTDHGEPMRTRATLAVSPWLFIRWSSLPIRKTSELPDFRTSKRIAALGEASAICTQWGFLRSDGTETERGREVGRRCCFETVGSVVALPGSTPAGLGKTGIRDDISRLFWDGGIENFSGRKV